MSIAETVGVIRDITIILFALAGVLAIVAVTVMGMALYRKVNAAVDSAKSTLKQTQEITSQVSEKVVKPFIGASAMSFSVGRVVAFFLGLSRGKKGKKDGK